MRHLQISISGGPTHCLLPTRCQYVLTRRMGTEWVCGIFRTASGEEAPLRDDDSGCLVRLPQCLAAEKGYNDRQ